MTLYFWSGLDIGGEYADAWIGVIASGRERALELIDSDERDFIRRFYGECYAKQPETLDLHPDEKGERVWLWAT